MGDINNSSLYNIRCRYIINSRDFCFTLYHDWKAIAEKKTLQRLLLKFIFIIFTYRYVNLYILSYIDLYCKAIKEILH